MKRATQLKAIAFIAIACSGFLVLFTVLILLLLFGSDNNKKALTVSAAESQERIEELMQFADMGIPSDIVMMITTFQCETEEEAKRKPFIGTALEFMVMTEIISEKHHTCSRYNEDGSDVIDDEAECDCDFEVVDTNFFYYKEGILRYLAAADEADAGVDAWSLEGKLQEVANTKAGIRLYDAIIKIQLNAIDDTLYEDAIRRCGIEDEDIIQAIIELHESGYYIEWFKECAAEFGLEMSEGIVTGGVNGVHSRIMAAVAGDTRPFAGGPYADPVSGWRGIVSCEFGGYVGHTGIDFAVPTGTPVYASVSGTVIITGSGNTGYGNYVVINHGGGIATLYAHNSSLNVSVGDSVSGGQVIAYSGNTGNSTGPHLHFEVVVNGIPKNPRGYLS